MSLIKIAKKQRHNNPDYTAQAVAGLSALALLAIVAKFHSSNGSSSGGNFSFKAPKFKFKPPPMPKFKYEYKPPPRPSYSPPPRPDFGYRKPPKPDFDFGHKRPAPKPDFDYQYKPPPPPKPKSSVNIEGFFKEHGGDSTKIKTKKEATKIYYSAAQKHHPDAGGNAEKFKPVSANWDKVKSSEWFNKLASLIKIAKRNYKMKDLKEHRVEMTKNELDEVFKRDATWHPGPEHEPVSAIWKSLDIARSLKIAGKHKAPVPTYLYITNTHRAIAVAPTLKGAINKFKFIKTTA